jgi:hypothetical protein
LCLHAYIQAGVKESLPIPANVVLSSQTHKHDATRSHVANLFSEGDEPSRYDSRVDNDSEEDQDVCAAVERYGAYAPERPAAIIPDAPDVTDIPNFDEEESDDDETDEESSDDESFNDEALDDGSTLPKALSFNDEVASMELLN